jgi:LmbE family N-acetylglucosaminyl deacetylase
VSETVVAVVAHPDDESLIAGGTLALAATNGVDAGVISLTRGEDGPVVAGTLTEGGSLGSLRERELQAAAGELGAAWAVCLRYPDGELEWADHHAVARELADLLAERGTVSVLTFGEDGLYWHPDHIAVRAIAGLAVDLLDERSSEPVWLYEAAWGPTLVADLVAAARERGLPSDVWGILPEAFGTFEQGPTVVVDVRDVLEKKLSALRCHRTQLGPDHLLRELPADLAEQFLGEERWRVARPPAAGEGPLGRFVA